MELTLKSTICGLSAIVLISMIQPGKYFIILFNNACFTTISIIFTVRTKETDFLLEVLEEYLSACSKSELFHSQIFFFLTYKVIVRKFK